MSFNPATMPVGATRAQPHNPALRAQHVQREIKSSPSTLGRYTSPLAERSKP